MSSTPRRVSRAERARRARPVFDDHDGIAHRSDLRRAGVSREDVRGEVAAGRWTTAGRHTVVRGETVPDGRARLWHAVWESGSGAVLDGASALVAGGLTGFTPVAVDVTLPRSSRRHPVEGVRSRRRLVVGPVRRAGIPRTTPEHATVRAAQWARSDHEAALVVCLAVQQRLVHPARLLEVWHRCRGGRRHRFLDAVVHDVCDGAHSLGELDLGGLCRRWGVPAPSRQAVRTTPHGRVYLDAVWEEVGLVVEVDGGHHALALAPVDDALRQNDRVLVGDVVLRIPVLGLRLRGDDFGRQLARAHALLRRRAA